MAKKDSDRVQHKSVTDRGHSRRHDSAIPHLNAQEHVLATLRAVAVMAKEMAPEIRELLFLSARCILGPTVCYGKSLEQLARGMREMPAEFDPKQFEQVEGFSWRVRYARSFDWLTVFERES